MRYIKLLDRFRNIRHEDQYDISFYATKKEAQDMISFAREFLKKIETILKH